MDTLLDRFKNTACSGHNISRLNPEEIADTLFCLCNAIEEGTLIQAAPENITIKEEGKVSVSLDTGLNIYYAAPEVVLGKKDADKNSGWFTFGLLAYFVIHGRSYYEDKSFHIVNLKEMMENESSFIMAWGVDEEAEDVPGLFSLSIQKFTSWDPECRSDGVPVLLRAIKQYSGTAEISYRYLDRIVATETIMVHPPNADCTKGSDVSGNDGKVYLVSENVSIPFRPGNHRYIVNVDLSRIDRPENHGFVNSGVSHDSPYERYLCIQVDLQPKKTRLIKLDESAQERKIEVDRRTDRRYLFYVLTGDPVRQKTICEEYKYYVDVPAGASNGSSLLVVAYDPANGVDIALYNRAGEKQISDKILHFEV